MFAVLGATSWGLTLAWRLASNGHAVSVVTRNEAEAARVRGRRGLERMPELQLPPEVEVVSPAALKGGYEGVIAAVPAQSMEDTIAAAGLSRDAAILSAAKGIEHRLGRRMSQLLKDSGWPEELVAVLSGPNLAHEIVRGLPAASVVASSNPHQAARWQTALSGGNFRVYRASDVVGVELGGALKNVIAIAAGACAGLGLGANATAAVMTRGLAEITRLGVEMGAEPLTFQGLAGVGDLAATCYSPLSRNRHFGELLALGRTVAEATNQIGEAVEGIGTAPVALRLGNARGVEMPITAQVCEVLDGRVTVKEAMAGLLSRPLASESSR